MIRTDCHYKVSRLRKIDDETKKTMRELYQFDNFVRQPQSFCQFNQSFLLIGKTFVRFLRATAGTAIARLSHRNSVRLSVRPSVRHTGGSGKNGAS